MKESNQGNPDGLACCRLGRKAGKGVGVDSEGRERKGASTKQRASQEALLPTPYIHPESAIPSPELHPGLPPISTLAAISAGC